MAQEPPRILSVSAPGEPAGRVPVVDDPLRRMCVVALGGGAGRVLDAMAAHVPDGVPRVAVDTDLEALENVASTTMLQVGEGRAKGAGAGGSLEFGRRCFEEDQALISGLFCDMRLAVVLACLGGGTGSGGLRPVLTACRDAGLLSVCVVTLPFAFESARMRDVARRTLAEIGELPDVLVSLPNSNLVKAGARPAFGEALALANRAVADAVGTLVRLLARPGLLRVGIGDLRRIGLGGRGLCSLGYARATGPNRVETAVRALFDCPLLDARNTLRRASRFLLGISAGTDLRVDELDAVINAVTARLGEDPDIKVGTVVEPGAGDELFLLLLSSEHYTGPVREEELPEDEAIVAEAPPATSAETPEGATPRETQAVLNLETPGKGRFKDMTPTYVDGEDLDVPTFLRRRILLER